MRASVRLSLVALAAVAAVLLTAVLVLDELTGRVVASSTGLSLVLAAAAALEADARRMARAGVLA